MSARRPERFFLCRTCRRCRVYSTEPAQVCRRWCAYCQAPQEFQRVPPMPTEGRMQAPAWEDTI